MVILIAEKPSVGRELARIVGATESHDGYISGGTISGKPCCVTWAVGHLVEIHAETPQQWNKSSLPVLPSRFELHPVKERKKQLEIIRTLLKSCEMVINCGDAGREGELIQRYILEWCKYNGPLKRLWISSLTDDAIRHGLHNLRPGSEFDSLYQAGKARNEADWLVGMNATMALTSTVRENQPFSRGVLSLGRVQTPALAMVCSRYIEHRDFVPEDFWRIRIKTSCKGTAFEVMSEKKYKNRNEAESDRRLAAVSLLDVVSAETERKSVMPPLLHDLTSLQKTANTRYSMSAEETLQAAQALYEKKLITYPRTGSKYITEDLLDTIPERIKTLVCNPMLGAYAEELLKTKPSKRCVNAGKVTDHHALLIEKTNLTGVNETEKKIYLLVAERMLEAFSNPCVEDIMTVRLTAAGIPFRASGTTIIEYGWKKIRGDQEKQSQEEADDKNQILPQIKAKDKLEIHKTELVQGTTKPKPLHTESTLLAAMESAGKNLENDQLKEAMKECGLGTPATRASIIETLKRRGYMRLEGKKLIPSESGLAVWKLTHDMLISNVEMTGQWEKKLQDIVDGKMTEFLFSSEIRKYANDVTQQIFETSVPNGITSNCNSEDSAICPLCDGKIIIKDDYAKCTNKTCGLYMNRTVFSKKLSTKTIRKLLEVKITGIVKGLKGKSGKEFEARLKLKLTEKDGKKYANAEPVFESKDTGMKNGFASTSKTRK